MFKLLFYVCVVVFLAGTAFVRLSPIAARHFDSRAVDPLAGAKIRPGGYRTAIAPLTQTDQDRLFAEILATPRTTERSTDLPNTRIFVHRSMIWGFADVTHVILADDQWIIDSHLVLGQSDMGVNKRRIEGWLITIS
ncbi:MAG: DUF1499 domain-containing protein [Pseudomonadota bacterium]